MKPQNHQSHTEPVYLSAATLFDGATPDEAGQGKFTATLYNGGAVFGGSVYVDLATLKVEPSVPVLADHDPEKVIGIFSAIVNSGQSLTADGVLFVDEDDQAETIYKKAKRGMKWQTSMGVFDYAIEDVPSGQAFDVNGLTAYGPATILRNGYLREGSIVALGADKTTSATFFTTRASAPILQKEGAPMPTQIEFDELKTELAAIKALLAEKDAALIAATTAQRTVEVKELFTAIGRDFDADKAAPYVALSADSFAAIAADMKAHAKATAPAAALPAHFSASAFSAQGVTQAPAENPLIAAMRGMNVIK